jgi:hypothetical protein
MDAIRVIQPVPLCKQGYGAERTMSTLTTALLGEVGLLISLHLQLLVMGDFDCGRIEKTKMESRPFIFIFALGPCANIFC